MHTLVFSSQKGGSGKTTLCAHLAVEAERAGHGPVYLIDTDPQATLTDWYKKRAAEGGPRLVTLPGAHIDAGLEKLRGLGAALVFIDTPGIQPDDPELSPLYEVADLVIVPIRPSPPDVWAAAATVSRLKDGDHAFRFLLTQVKARTNITAQTVALLSHYGAVMPTLVADRVSYATSLADGRTAAELAPHGPAAIELAELWTSLHAALQPPAPALRKEA